MLVRSAFSANIKERRDCSTALFDEQGRMIAQAEHIPVHLGAMPDAVAAVRRHAPEAGEVWALNDPYEGGTHLPDITLVSRTEVGFAVTRAHHADVGGREPGSMPADSRTLDEEGVVITPTRLDDEAIASLVARMRNPHERRGDLRAQLSAHRLAEQRVAELCARRGREHVVAAMDELYAYSERSMRAGIAALPDGRYEARDVLEGIDGDLEVHATVTIDGRRSVDRLHRHRASARRQPQLSLVGRALGVLLRPARARRPGPARVGRRLRAGHRDRTGRLPRQRPATRRRCGRQRRDVVADRGRRHACVRPGDRRARAGTRDDEQRHARQRPLHVLRDDRRRSGRLPGCRRAERCPCRDVEHALDAGRGARAPVSAARRALRPAARARVEKVRITAATVSSASCACWRAAGSRSSASAAATHRRANAAARPGRRPEPAERRAAPGRR